MEKTCNIFYVELHRGYRHNKKLISTDAEAFCPTVNSLQTLQLGEELKALQTWSPASSCPGLIAQAAAAADRNSELVQGCVSQPKTEPCNMD